MGSVVNGAGSCEFFVSIHDVYVRKSCTVVIFNENYFSEDGTGWPRQGFKDYRPDACG